MGENFVVAVITIAARDVMKDHHPVTDLEICNIATNSGHHACGFMSEDAGRRVRATGNLLQIRAADTTGVYLDQDLAWAYFRHRNCL